jgi:hypothetical protein
MGRASPPGDQLDKLLILKEEMERAKALYEAAKKEYDRALEKTKNIGVLPIAPDAHQALQLYASRLTHYQQVTMEFNQYLLDQTFPYSKSSSAEGAEG